jgi:hypothetical protein
MIFEFLQIFFENVTRPSTNGSYTRSLYKHMSLLGPRSPLSLLSLLSAALCLFCPLPLCVY